MAFNGDPPRPCLPLIFPTTSWPRWQRQSRGVIEDDKFPHAPRLDPLRAALARLDAATKLAPHPKAAPPAKADKRARR
jgi:hypothetical protein